MSEDSSDQSQLERVGDITGRSADPLEQHSEVVKQIEREIDDPFNIFLKQEKEGSVRQGTLDQYEQAFRQFQEFTKSTDRHPTCVNTGHVERFIKHEQTTKNNKKSTIKKKIQKLDTAFEFFQRESVFPQGSEYNPFANAKKKANWSDQEKRDPPSVSLSELRDIFENITHIRHRILVMLGFKLGMRQGEIRNMELQDIHIRNRDVQEHYSNLGTHERIGDRKNVIYIPSRYKRQGNKSKRGRLLPLDEEVRYAFLNYLLIRPDCGEPNVFVSQTDHEKISDKNRLNQVWREEVASQIETKSHHRPVRSHFGRHWFTSYWSIKDDLDRERIKYMRGDKTGKTLEQSEAIDEYIHTYFEDIKDEYLNRIFKLDI